MKVQIKNEQLKQLKRVLGEPIAEEHLKRKFKKGNQFCKSGNYGGTNGGDIPSPAFRISVITLIPKAS